MINFKKNQLFVMGAVVGCALATVVCVMRVFCQIVPTESTVLRVGMMSGWEPFMTVANDGSYKGFDVDVANELGRRLDRQVQVIDLGSLAPCFLALEQNKVDLVMSGLDITQQRMAKWNMVRYIGQDVREFKLLFWDSIPDGVQSIADLVGNPNMVVCVEPGSAQERLALQYQGLALKQLAKVADMILDLEYGKSTTALLEPQVAARFVRIKPQLKLLPVQLPKEFCVYGEGIVVRKQDSALTQQVQSAIDQMRADGTMDRLQAVWFGNDNAV